MDHFRLPRASACAVSFLLVSSLSGAQPRDTRSDTWVATDGLGRTLPTHDEVGAPRPDRTVGVFYYFWHQRTSEPEVYDITRIIQGRAQPWSDAPWGPSPAFHWWGEPHLGHYEVNDDFVIRSHAQMLGDAGVDVVLFDVTNAITYDATYQKLCGIYQQLRAEGRRTPQIAFLTNSSSDSVVTRLYDDFYAPGTCSELWFIWEGKPLILASGDTVAEPMRSFFTFRQSWAWTGSTGWFGDGQDKWPWLDSHPQNYGWHVDPATPEQIPVGTAQHPTGNYGKSYHDGAQPPLDADYVTADTDLGLGFQEQWDRAIEVDPRFVLVTQWNEWLAQRFVKCGAHDTGATHMLGRQLECGDTHFIDVFNREFNRDIEPMRGGWGDNYYYQLVANVRRFKGARPPLLSSPPAAIDLEGDFSQWDGVAPEFLDDAGDVTHRDWHAYAGPTVYQNASGRNDIVTAKVARDFEQLYFYVQTAGDLTADSDPQWMMLLIDADQDTATGWQGFDFLLNRNRSAGTCALERSTGAGFAWEYVADVPLRHAGGQLQLAVARALLGVSSTPGELALDFKWVDNIPDRPSPLDFIDQGDVAPNGRFAYRFVEDPATATMLVPGGGAGAGGAGGSQSGTGASAAAGVGANEGSTGGSVALLGGTAGLGVAGSGGASGSGGMVSTAAAPTMAPAADAPDESGCGCRAASGHGDGGWWVGLLLAMGATRRRRLGRPLRSRVGLARRAVSP